MSETYWQGELADVQQYRIPGHFRPATTERTALRMRFHLYRSSSINHSLLVARCNEGHGSQVERQERRAAPGIKGKVKSNAIGNRTRPLGWSQPLSPPELTAVCISLTSLLHIFALSNIASGYYHALSLTSHISPVAVKGTTA